MKILALSLIMFSLGSFAQEKNVNLEISQDGIYDAGHWFNTIHEDEDAHLEPGKGEFHVLPAMINITSFVNENGLDLDTITIEDLQVAAFGFGTADLDDPKNLAVKEKNKLFMTAEGNFLSLEKRTVFYKGKAAKYAAFHFIDLKLGAAVKLGDEFYVQLEAYGSYPGVQLGKGSEEAFAISESEFEEFKSLVGCGNCDRGHGEAYNTESVDAMFKYGGELKVKYKRIGVSLFNNNYYGKSSAVVYSDPSSGNESMPDYSRLQRRRTVREFGIELDAKVAKLGKRGSINAMIGYALSVHQTRTLRKDLSYKEGIYNRPYAKSRNEIELESTPNLESMGRVNFGIKLKF